MDKFSIVSKQVIDFNIERDWEKFHNPKDLSISLSIEVSELLECFQWKTNNEIKKKLEDISYRKNIEEEIADVGNYLILLCHELNIDLLQVISDKCIKNSIKYPVDKCKGKADKYTNY